jgi:hypothetical protein
MHFPDSKLPPVAPTIDRTEITPKAPISPSQKVVPGFQNILEGKDAGPHDYREADVIPEAVRTEPLAYDGEERRMMCRRLFSLPVLLDTRSGEERRKYDQLGESPPTHLNRDV